MERQKKVANIITNQNDLIIVTYSACENIGIEAELSAGGGSTALTQEYVSAKVIWLAKKIIENQRDLDKIKKILKQKKYTSFFKNGIYNKKPMILDLVSKRYSEVTFGIEIVNEKLVVNLAVISY